MSSSFYRCRNRGDYAKRRKFRYIKAQSGDEIHHSIWHEDKGEFEVAAAEVSWRLFCSLKFVFRHTHTDAGVDLPHFQRISISLKHPIWLVVSHWRSDTEACQDWFTCAVLRGLTPHFAERLLQLGAIMCVTPTSNARWCLNGEALPDSAICAVFSFLHRSPSLFSLFSFLFYATRGALHLKRSLTAFRCRPRRLGVLFTVLMISPANGWRISLRKSLPLLGYHFQNGKTLAVC